MKNSTEINEAVEALRRGELIAFPTETVYGLGADATSDQAVAKVFAAKGRPSFNPLISHVAEAQAAFDLGAFPGDAKKLAEAFWPGPLTIVVRRTVKCPVSLLASAGLPSIALRVPDHPLALELLRALGRPVVAPSANLSGRVSPTTAAHVKRGFGKKISVILDGGPCAVGVESTVISFMGTHTTLLRPGGLPRGEIEKVVGHDLDVEVDSTRPHAPGQMESHYAPHAFLRLDATAPRKGESYLGFGAHDNGPYTLSARGDVIEAAANLFRMLHEMDGLGVKAIAVAPIPNEGLGEAINDRLHRAAAPRPET